MSKQKTTAKSGLSIVIPCLNEVKTIEAVVKKAYESVQKELNSFEIMVADNGSTDGSLEKLKKIKYVRTIHVPIKGYGAALHYGILAARYPYVLYGDADLSYDFSQTYKFIPFRESNHDLVLGSRLHGKILPGAMPFLNRYVGTPVLTALIKIFYHINVTDCNSGMRMVKKSFYKSLEMKNSGMEWASELLIKTALHNGLYAEVPIIFRKDKRGALPHLKRWEDGWRHLKVIILLRPQLVLFAAVIFSLFALFFMSYSLFTTIALLLFSEFIFLSYLVTKKIEAALTNTENTVSVWLERIPLVLIGVVITLSGITSLFLISDDHLFTKYILFFQVVMYDLWLFFIETIKTHMVHILDEKLHATK